MSDTPSDGIELDVAAIVEVLNRHEVNYVVIGGVAAETWATSLGIPVRPTTDVDVTPASDPANLERLSEALRELGARIRTEGMSDGLPFEHDGTSLARAVVWNLICRAGSFDLSLVPSGTEGYPDLARRARLVVIGGVEAPIADLADVIRSKKAANRPKDLETLPALEEALRLRDLQAGDSESKSTS
jgi:hypothetical protein